MDSSLGVPRGGGRGGRECRARACCQSGVVKTAVRNHKQFRTMATPLVPTKPIAATGTAKGEAKLTPRKCRRLNLFRYYKKKTFEIGDIMLISDHINLFPTNPLMGPNLDELGPRFPDMSQAYSKDILKEAENVAAEMNIHVVKGIYAGLSGPTLETPAEYMYVRNIHMLYFEQIAFGPMWWWHPKMDKIIGFGNVCGPRMGPTSAIWSEIQNFHIDC